MTSFMAETRHQIPVGIVGRSRQQHPLRKFLLLVLLRQACQSLSRPPESLQQQHLHHLPAQPLALSLEYLFPQRPVPILLSSDGLKARLHRESGSTRTLLVPESRFSRLLINQILSRQNRVSQVRLVLLNLRNHPGLDLMVMKYSLDRTRAAPKVSRLRIKFKVPSPG
jgi:hypothetical protein